MGSLGKSCTNNAPSVLLIALIATALHGAVVATEYTVGNATGWDFAPTSTYYDDWSSSLNFVPGDKLVFKYLPSAHNVQEVNETDYKTCNSLNPIAEYESGNDVISFPKPGTHFYICGFLGHCDQGGMRMKTVIVDRNLSSTPLIPGNVPPTSPELPSPMTSMVVPPAPSPHPLHGRAHAPAAAPTTIPGHSAGYPTHDVPRLDLVAVSTFALASGAVSCLFW